MLKTEQNKKNIRNKLGPVRSPRPGGLLVITWLALSNRRSTEKRRKRVAWCCSLVSRSRKLVRRSFASSPLHSFALHKFIVKSNFLNTFFFYLFMILQYYVHYLIMLNNCTIKINLLIYICMHTITINIINNNARVGNGRSLFYMNELNRISLMNQLDTIESISSYLFYNF